MTLQNLHSKNPFSAQAKRGVVTEDFAAAAEKFWLRRSRILILVDGSIAVLPDPLPEIGQDIIQSSSAFGLAVAIGEIKKFAAGFCIFEVKVATRDGDGSPLPGHDITGFRFSVD